LLNRSIFLTLHLSDFRFRNWQKHGRQKNERPKTTDQGPTAPILECGGKRANDRKRQRDTALQSESKDLAASLAKA